MTHLKIEQNTTGIEEVSHSIIEKLYNLAISGDLDASSNLLGRLHVPATYRSYVDYLTTNYPNLYITSSDYYVKFADPEVARIFALSNYGDGFGLLLSTVQTITNLNNVTISGTGNLFKNNTTIERFNELGLFTSVTSIPQECFRLCTNLTEVVLPDTLTTIQLNAFGGCTSLQSINLPSTITNLNDYVFRDCSSIPFGNLSLPNLVSSRGWSAFENCLGLQKVSNLGSIPKLNGRFFSNCTNLTEVVLPSTCISLEEGTFNNCSNLEKVNLDSIQYIELSNINTFNNCLKLRVLNYQNLLNPTGIALNNVETTHSYRERAFGTWFIAPGATDIYLPKFDTLMGGRDDTSRTFSGWFSGSGWYRKSTGNANTPAWNTIYLRDVTTVGKGAFCGCDIVNLVINSNVVPTVTELQWGYTTYNGKLFEGNHTIQHIYVKPELVNDFKNDTYWGEKASIIESIANCPRKTANEVLAGEVGLVDAWM